MWKYISKPFRRFIPQHIENPVGLVYRMLASGSRSAIFTLWLTGLGLVLTPIDILLNARERRTIDKHQAESNVPIIFVCGPARSGTTVTYQLLSHYLPVQYIRNITTLFPRSPITATRCFGRFFRARRELDLDNYYGKTPGMLGPSEANHIWNRWVEPDRTGFRTVLSPENASEMAAFFRALLAVEHQPLLNKNNNMNVFADVVFKHLPNSFFLCLRRNPAFLAQSLLAAREEIRGNIKKGYGVENAAEDEPADEDPIKTVCQQVKYLDTAAIRMQSEIGANRFWIVSYEEFCQDPGSLIRRISAEILHAKPDEKTLRNVSPLEPTNKVKNVEQMRMIVEYLHNLGVSFDSPVDDLSGPGLNSPIR